MLAQLEMGEVALRIRARMRDGAAYGVGAQMPLSSISRSARQRSAMAPWSSGGCQRVAPAPSQDYGNGLSGLITQNRSMIAWAKPLQLTASTWGSINRARS